MPVPWGMSSGGTPEYGAAASTPNSACANSPGGIKYLASTQGYGATQCNYLFLGDTAGDSANGGTITTNAGDPIFFLYVDYTGKYASAAAELDQTHYYTNLMVSTTSATTGYAYYANGFTVPGKSTTCERHQPNCTPGVTQPTPLYGQCPGHNLYGAMYSSNQTPDPSGTPAVDFDR